MYKDMTKVFSIGRKRTERYYSARRGAFSVTTEYVLGISRVTKALVQSMMVLALCS